MFKSLKILLALATLITLAACGGGGGGNQNDLSLNADPGQTPSNTNLTVLNYMSTSNYVKDGVGAVGLIGTNSSTGTTVTRFPFATLLAPQASVNVYMSSSQCDVYWDLTPIVDPATKLTLIPNSGKKLFVPCGKTLACTATIKYFGSIGFADLSCSTPM